MLDRLLVSDLVRPRTEEVTNLERLRAELGNHGLTAELVATAKQACLKVANADMPELHERVLCRTADDRSLCFWWPWGQPIGSVDDLEAVSYKIFTVLRSVECPS